MTVYKLVKTILFCLLFSGLSEVELDNIIDFI
jgi:hypothetical protein